MRNFFYYIWFVIAVLASPVFAKDLIYFRAQCPEFIPENNAFEVSVITAKQSGLTQALDFYLITDGKSYLAKADLHLIAKTIPLKFERTSLGGVSGYAYKMRINFSDTSFYNSDYFQSVFAPRDFRLSQNFPNPFNPNARIPIEILEDSV